MLELLIGLVGGYVLKFGSDLWTSKRQENRADLVWRREHVADAGTSLVALCALARAHAATTQSAEARIPVLVGGDETDEATKMIELAATHRARRDELMQEAFQHVETLAVYADDATRDLAFDYATKSMQADPTSAAVYRKLIGALRRATNIPEGVANSGRLGRRKATPEIE